jgi:plastocyanin
MKKIFVVLAILFIGILLAGCTSQPAAPVTTPVPTPVPTTVVTTVPPTPVPTKEVVVVVVKTTNVTATPTATPTPVPTYTITFDQNRLISNGPTATVKVGTKVIWANMDNLYPHGLVATDIANDGFWLNDVNAASIPLGKTVAVTFTKAGAYDYMTLFQPAQAGIIYVTA